MQSKGDRRGIKTVQVVINISCKNNHHRKRLFTGRGEAGARRSVGRSCFHFATELIWYGLWGNTSARDFRLVGRQTFTVLISEIVRLVPDVVHFHDIIGLRLGAAAAQAITMSGRAVPWVHDVHEFAAGLTGEATSHMPKGLG